jgi:hypothetical protein
MIFNDRPTCQMIRPMVSCGARKVDNKILTFLEFPHSNTAGTLLVFYINNFTIAQQTETKV